MILKENSGMDDEVIQNAEAIIKSRLKIDDFDSITRALEIVELLDEMRGKGCYLLSPAYKYSKPDYQVWKEDEYGENDLICCDESILNCLREAKKELWTS